MSRYAVYIRTKEGNIERMKNVICGYPLVRQAPYGALAPYMHEEPLEGFPESLVLWAASKGPTVGIAPLNSRPESGKHKLAGLLEG
ncbi:MAG: hypothetical protein H0X43_01755 [Nitrosospira sp.]|nr:hypothetical protein [Nitrosospira sp.]